MDAQEFRNLKEVYLEIYEELDEAFKPMNEPKMQSQIKKHLTRNNAKRERGESGVDNRVGNMRNVINVIGKQQKSKSFADKKTEKGRRTFAKQNADKFLRKDNWHGAKDKLGYTLTVPNRHIARDEEGHKKHIERLKKSGVNAESFDIYDIIFLYLFDEGYVNTPEAAEAIMVNMSEEWRKSIVEAFHPVYGRGGAT
jgi:hypothetical protein